jgi:hypothetical protein
MDWMLLPAATRILEDTMTRAIVKVFCPRNHRVGTVTANSDGLTVDYTGEVWHTTGIFGATSRLPLSDDDATDFAAYCPTCKKSVALNTRTLRDAALGGRRDAHAPFSDTIDKTWTSDRGRKPLYAPGLTRFKDDPRSRD